MEKLSRIWLVAGMLCFVMAGLVSGLLPVLHLKKKMPVKTLEEIAPQPSAEFLDLARRYPKEFAAVWGAPDVKDFHEALRLGRDTYIAEACWHCHSQYVRPVSNEDVRFGKVSWSDEYMNEMFLPHLFGTRRVGPDLIRESLRHGNDWHVAHFYDPQSVVPSTVMPRYSWFFDGDRPNKIGFAVITYVQWLGSWARADVLAGRIP